MAKRRSESPTKSVTLRRGHKYDENPVKSTISRGSRKYDVIIVGGGPAGIFAALELCQAADAKVLLIEKGKDIDARRCPLQETGGGCLSCSPCHLVSGLGGAGAFSDGKLTLSSQVGGQLGELLGGDQIQELIDYVDSLYLRFGASDRVYGVGEAVDELRRRATLAELKLVPVKLRHMGTERSRQVLKSIRDSISHRVEMRLEEMATAIIVDDGVVAGVETSRGGQLKCRYLVLAPGREGADWLTKEAERLKLSLNCNPIDVGVRVEVPAPVLEELTSVLYESKLEFFSKSFDDRVRTFCMCPGGEVIMEASGGADPVVTVNGSSYAEHKTGNTNFAILVSTTFTEPFREPIAYGKYLARLANLLSGGVLVQRLGDLMEGHRSTLGRIQHNIVQPTLKAATPGDLSFVLPFRHLKDIVEMLQAMDKLAPGVASRHTLLYGIEVKFYSSQLELSPCLETEIGNMFAAGDGAGVSRGLVQASACGVVVAREILRRLGKP
ncbi:MAG TPA: FAD-dependent oxidoreductase [Dehalococcoidia bacterium]|nr:FAD-dependent oxidoreductase [Dehalococcoidia bacterium]